MLDCARAGNTILISNPHGSTDTSREPTRKRQSFQTRRRTGRDHVFLWAMASPDRVLELTFRKGDRCVALRLETFHRADNQAEGSIYTRTPGTLVNDYVKSGAIKRTVSPSHAAGERLFHHEVTKLAGQGFVPVVRLFSSLANDEELDLIVAHGGSLAAPALGSPRALIFVTSRDQGSAISSAEDRVLRRHVDAVGLHSQDDVGTTLLHVAARLSSVALAHACLDAGMDPDALNAVGHSPRFLAQALAPENTARDDLLQRFESRSGPVAPTVTDLHRAAGYGEVAAVRRLLAAGIPVDAPDPADPTRPARPLFHAVGSKALGSVEVVTLLLAAGADALVPPDLLRETLGWRMPDAVAIPKLQRLVQAGARLSEVETLELLDDAQAGVDTRRALLAALREVDAFTVTLPLSTAVLLRDVDAAKAALARGEDPNGTIAGLPLLLLAATEGGHSFADRQGATHFTPLAPASLPLVECLLAAGADPTTRTDFTDDDELPQTLAPFLTAGDSALDSAHRALGLTERLTHPVSWATRVPELQAIEAALAAALRARGVTPAMRRKKK